MINLISALLTKKDTMSSIDRYVQSNKSTATMTLLIQSEDGKTLLDKSKGGLSKDRPFVIASISKLYTYAIIYSLIDQGKLAYEDRLSNFFPASKLDGLHTLKGTNHAPQITIRMLIDQTSGLPDYETDKQPNGSIIFKEIITEDKPVEFDTSLEITKSLTPKFAPGTGNRAYYANMNANLLAKIAEIVSGESYESLLGSLIIAPLSLKSTYPCRPDTQHEPINIGPQAVIRPQYLASSVASGGIIASNTELMIFIRAFFQGKLFDTLHITNPEFRPIQFFPIKYGSGMMQVQMSRLMSPLLPAPTLIGHSGSSGSFAYYCPERKVYITGTINQIKSRPFPLMYMYLDALSRAA